MQSLGLQFIIYSIMQLNNKKKNDFILQQQRHDFEDGFILAAIVYPIFQIIPFSSLAKQTP